MELTYAINTGWTDIVSDIGLLAEHVAADQADPQYALLTNSTAYLYMAVKFADNYGGSNYMGIRRIELQTEDGGGWTHIAKINGIPVANIAKINGVPVAQIAKINGIAV